MVVRTDVAPHFLVGSVLFALPTAVPCTSATAPEVFVRIGESAYLVVGVGELQVLDDFGEVY